MTVFAGRACLLVKYVVGPPPCCGAAEDKLLKIDSGAPGRGDSERARRCVRVTSGVVVVAGRGRRRYGCRMLVPRDRNSLVVCLDAPSILAGILGCMENGRMLEMEGELVRSSWRSKVQGSAFAMFGKASSPQASRLVPRWTMQCSLLLS